MPQAKHGDRVRVHYTGKLPDGSVFDSSVDREPIEFTIGADEVIPGFEQAVVGMAPGEKKTATIAAEDAYGPRDEDLLIEVGRDQLPEGLDPKVGDRLQMRQSTGRTMVVTVSAVSETSVTLDANHPLAGQDLTFEIELVEIA